MITHIGIVAGEIWDFLERKGEVYLEELVKEIDASSEVILMSLGWLAREGHVVVQDIDGRYKINLR